MVWRDLQTLARALTAESRRLKKGHRPFAIPSHDEECKTSDYRT
jgi:hypothetical protein